MLCTQLDLFININKLLNFLGELQNQQIQLENIVDILGFPSYPDPIVHNGSENNIDLVNASNVSLPTTSKEGFLYEFDLQVCYKVKF